MKWIVLVLAVLILTGCTADGKRSVPIAPTTVEQPVTIIRTDFPNGG